MLKAAAKSKQAGKSKKSPTQKKRDQALDQALAESFPGSDPVSVTQPAPTQPNQERETGDHLGAGKSEKQPA
jgi:hypothetical protein